MQVPNSRNKLFQRQIPTILGLIILVVGLGAGLFFFSDGLGVFAPRATPQTTPKNVKVTNVSDTGFTVSFLTDDATPGYVKYGTEANSLRSQAGDDRDQLSGSVGNFTVHHITVRGLDPNTSYYYVLGTGTSAEFDDNGQPFSVQTAQRGGTPTAAKTVYGNVLNSTGGPAEGSVVYVASSGMGEMSSLVRGSGSWAVPLSNARTPDGAGYAQITDNTQLTINVQGPQLSQISSAVVTVQNAQPVETLTLGQDGPTQASQTVPTQTTTDPIDTTDPTDPTDPTSPGAQSLSALPSASPSASPTPALATAPEATASATVVDLTQATIPTITTSQPIITGEAAPNVVVNITVNSETQIVQQVTANAAGEFELDLSQLESQLEPGEHSVQYSYVDPATGQTITQTKSFTVQPTAMLAQASTQQTQPFGSANPVPIGGATQSATTASPSPSPSPTPTATISASPTATASATPSGRTSQPSTASGIPASGSVGMTYALVIGGVFFLITGIWSFWISRQLREESEYDAS